MRRSKSLILFKAVQAVIEEARRVKDKFKEENRGAINIIQK